MTDMADTPSVTRDSARKRRVVLVCLVVALILTGFVVWRQYFETYHLVVVDPGKVYRDGNRSLREFRNTLRKTNPRTIVAIIDQQEYNEPEFVAARELAQSRGIEWIWIPVRAGAYPRPEQVEQFLQIARHPGKQPVLYHDDEGIRRAGMMMAAYQQSVLGYSDEQAKAAIRAFGHSDRTINDVRRFIDAYDPVKGLMVDLNPAPATTQSVSAGE